jgi:hypothetical protein
MKKHKAEKPYYCPSEGCKMQFRHKNSLVRHLCQHTGERPHPCQICGQAFISIHRMKEHVKKYHPKAALEIKNNALSEVNSLSSITTSQEGDSVSSDDTANQNKTCIKFKHKKKQRAKKRSIPSEESFPLNKTQSNLLDPIVVSTEKSDFIVQDNLPTVSCVAMSSTSHETVSTTTQLKASIQTHMQPTASLNIPIMSLVQATNGQMFLLTTNQQQPQYSPVPDANVNSSSPLTMNSLGYLTASSPVQPYQLSPPPPLLLPQGHSNQPQLFSNIINQNNFHTMIISQLPSSSPKLSSKPTIISRKEPDGTVANINKTFQKLVKTKQIQL